MYTPSEASREELTRRMLIKKGCAAGGVALIAAHGKHAHGQWRDGDGGWDWDGSRDDWDGSSPPTTPFVEALPIPPWAEPVAALDPPPNPNAHQRYNEFLPRVFYDVSMEEALHSFHPQLPPNRIWGFDGIFPGPTFVAGYGEPILVRFRNNLPPDHVGYGIPSVITHLHNAHTASESDGFAFDYYEVGAYKDHHYANVLAGYDAFRPMGDVREALGTLFYHDHRADFTAPNVYKGLSGFYLLFDARDSGAEDDTYPGAFRLPSGEYDVPLMFADKRFSPDGQLFFDQFDLDGFIGDKYTVNGKIQPFFKVARRKYRFRMLDSGPSRFYEFFLSNGQSFTQISNDGNLLPAPLVRPSIRLGVAERVDVIVDFTNARIGDQIFLQNRLKQSSGRGPDGLESPGTPVLRFDVDRDAPDPSRVPTTLRTLPPVDTSSAVATRTWSFDERNGSWTINGRLFDGNRVDARVKKGTAEIWVLRNERRNWSHPVHIHFEEFQIISRNGNRPPADEVSRKDVVRLAPGEEVRIFMRFRDFVGRHLMHCHNTIHEDHAMMIRWDIVP